MFYITGNGFVGTYLCSGYNIEDLIDSYIHFYDCQFSSLVIYYSDCGDILSSA